MRKAIGFLPMDIEYQLVIISNRNRIELTETINILNALVDSEISIDMLKTSKTNSGFNFQKKLDKKVNEIWDLIEPFYNGQLIGNQYYSTLRNIIEYSIINHDIPLLIKYKPFRKYQK